MRSRLTVALSSLLAIVPALAQERFAVEGTDVAGIARLDAQSLELSGKRFSKKERQGSPVAIKATVVSKDAQLLRLRYSRKKGFIASLWPGPNTEDVTVALRAAEGGGWEGAIEGLALRLRPEAAPAADLVVLVVPGLSTNLWNQYGVPYLDENMAVLQARGLTARRLAINTEDSVAANAAVIGAEVRREVAAGKRVVLMAHSKGGADTITALSDPKNADLLPRVVGLIAIQPVYAGSPVADEVGRSPLIQKLADKAFECIFPVINKVDDHGSGDAVRDLRSGARAEALRAHPYPAARVPTVVIRGYFEGRKLGKIGRHVLCEPLVGLQLYLEKLRNLKSDGMVSLENQSIPGAVAEHTFADLDHFEPGFRNESPHSPSEITAKALELMLPKLAR